jgi:hypothetical protein
MAHRWLHHKMDATHLKESTGVALGFGKAASFVMMGYVAIKIIGISVDNNWHYLTTGWGAWFLVELIGFVLFPAILYSVGAREKKLTLIRIASMWTVLGIVLNRLNVSLIAFNWNLPTADRYVPSFMEVGTTIFIVFLGITAYRIITAKMPILSEHPDYKEEH